jgi:AcrR family transcriptional regulator
MGKATKERILTEGVDLLSRGGFSGVTLGVLAEQTGMSKSGLFAHFKSKDEVLLELLDKTTRIGFTSFVQPAMKNAPGLGRLRAVVHGWLGWTEKAGLAGGCPVAAGMFEFDDAPESDLIRRRLFSMEERWRVQLAQLVTEAIESGEFRRDLDVDQCVWELCGIYLNHHASHRFIRDPLAFNRAERAFESLIERSLAAHTSGKPKTGRVRNRQRTRANWAKRRPVRRIPRKDR